jgi:anti-anti-sigma factor
MLNVVTERSEDNKIVRCRGRLVAGADLWSLYNTVARDEKTRGVVLDLTEVTRVDARGLGILVGLSLRAAGAGIRLELIPSKHVQKMLDLASLYPLFEIRSSETLCSPADLLNVSQGHDAARPQHA